MSTMKAVLALCLLACSLTAIAAQKTYTNRFDNVDVDNILANNRILSNYMKCLLDKGPCTAEGRELKKLLPDALASNCAKCTEVQKKNSNKVINFLRTNKPGEWNILVKKYDPKGTYRTREGV